MFKVGIKEETHFSDFKIPAAGLKLTQGEFLKAVVLQWLTPQKRCGVQVNKQEQAGLAGCCVFRATSRGCPCPEERESV